MTLHQESSDEFDALAGANIATLRKARGMTQAQLADAVAAKGVPFRQQTIVKIEKGQRPLRFREADALADALDVEIGSLLHETPQFDDMALLLSHMKSVHEKCDEVRSAATKLLEYQEALKFTLGTVARRGTPVSKYVLDQAQTALNYDVEAIVQSAIAVRAAEMEVSNAEMIAAVEWQTFEMDEKDG